MQPQVHLLLLPVTPAEQQQQVILAGQQQQQGIQAGHQQQGLQEDLRQQQGSLVSSNQGIMRDLPSGPPLQGSLAVGEGIMGWLVSRA
jgi:hypothetical protein